MRDAGLGWTYLRGYLELGLALETSESAWRDLLIQLKNSEIAVGQFFAIRGRKRGEMR